METLKWCSKPGDLGLGALRGSGDNPSDLGLGFHKSYVTRADKSYISHGSLIYYDIYYQHLQAIKLRQVGPNFEANDTTTLWSERRNAADCRLRGNMFLLDELAKMLMDLASRQLKLVHPVKDDGHSYCKGT